MRAFVFIVPIFLATAAFGQLGQVTVTQIGQVKITQFGFNSPQVAAGQFGGTVVGEFNPGGFPNPYFSQPIPDGGPQLGFIAGTQTPPIIELVSGRYDANEHVFSAYVGTSIPFPGAGFKVFVNADTGLQGPHTVEYATADPAPGTFQLVSLTVPSAPPGFIGSYYMYLTVGNGAGVLPHLTFLDDASLVEGPPGQVPEPSSSVIACLAGIALARRRRSRS